MMIFRHPKISFLGGTFLFSLFFELLVTPSLLARESLSFQGHMDFTGKKLHLTVGDGNASRVVLNLSELSEHHFQILLDLEHIKASVFDISSQLEGDLTLAEASDNQKPALRGELKSRYSLVNHKPVEELQGTFEIKDHILYLSSLSVGPLDLKGLFKLNPPYDVNLAIQFRDFPLNDFLVLWIDDPDFEAQGTVSGDVQISGVPQRLALKGNLASYEGQLEDFPYNSIVLHLAGEYPVVKLINSTVTQPDGLGFQIDGSLDLSTTQKLKKDIKSLSKSALITEGDSHWEWTIKSDENPQNATSVKYFLKKKDEALQGSSKDDTDLLGVEQRIKF